MKKGRSSKQAKERRDAVLLIPEPEKGNGRPSENVKPGYYNLKEMLTLIERNKMNASVVQYIADMLETGNPDYDGFSKMLRRNHGDPVAIARIIRIAKGK